MRVVRRRSGLELTLLVVPDCPHAELLDQRLESVLTNWTALTVIRRTITDLDQAERWGMRGSPTVLVDGIDPFAAGGQRPSLSCRLYWGPDGRADGAPSIQALRDAIEHALR
jgi:hypothetical protein